FPQPRVNQRERVASSFAKKAAAFFRISRSSRSWRFSFRSCDNSSRSAVVSPVRPLVRLARARCTPIGADFLSPYGVVVAITELVLFFPVVLFAIRAES